MNLNDIAEALARALEKGTGIPTYPYVPDNCQLPAIWIAPLEVSRSTFGHRGALYEAMFHVIIPLERGSDEQAYQVAARNLVRPDVEDSVWTVIDDLTDLDGTVQRIGIDKATFIDVTSAGQTFFAVQYEVRVLA